MIVNINFYFEKECVYWVDVKFVVGGVDSVFDVQLKVFLGYDIFVYVQFDEFVFIYFVRYDGDDVYFINIGNIYFVMFDGEQCDSCKCCVMLLEWYLYFGVEVRILFDEDKQFVWYCFIMCGQEFCNIMFNKGGN